MLNRTSRLCRILAKATSGDGFRKITKQSLDMEKLMTFSTEIEGHYSIGLLLVTTQSYSPPCQL